MIRRQPRAWAESLRVIMYTGAELSATCESLAHASCAGSRSHRRGDRPGDSRDRGQGRFVVSMRRSAALSRSCGFLAHASHAGSRSHRRGLGPSGSRGRGLDLVASYCHLRRRAHWQQRGGRLQRRCRGRNQCCGLRWLITLEEAIVQHTSSNDICSSDDDLNHCNATRK